MRYRVVYASSVEALESQMNQLNAQGYTLSEFSTSPAGVAGMVFLYAVMVNKNEGIG